MGFGEVFDRAGVIWACAKVPSRIFLSSDEILA